MALYRFIGKDSSSPHSMGLKKGSTYEIEQEDSYGTNIIVRITNPSNPYSGIQTPYRDIHAFNKNWEKI